MNYKLIFHLLLLIISFLTNNFFVESKVNNEIIKNITLTNNEKYNILSSLAEVRFSYFNFTTPDGSGIKCNESFGYSELNFFLLSRKPLEDLIKTRNIMRECIRYYSLEALSNYKQFLRKKIFSNSKFISGVFSIKPENIYFSDLSNLAFSVYAVTALTEEIKNSGDYSVVLKYPQELQMESEIMSNLKSYKKFQDYDTGLKVCMSYGMKYILLYIDFDKDSVVTSFKRFSHISKVLSILVKTELSNYNYKENLSSSKNKDSSKNLEKIIEKLNLLQRLLGYSILTKSFLSSDIINFEKLSDMNNQFKTPKLEK